MLILLSKERAMRPALVWFVSRLLFSDVGLVGVLLSDPVEEALDPADGGFDQIDKAEDVKPKDHAEETGHNELTHYFIS
jgi:hypothetical protein